MIVLTELSGTDDEAPGARRLDQEMQKLDKQIADTSSQVRKLDVELRTAIDHTRAARENARQARKDLQALPLRLMHIDGTNPNGGGMSRPGQASYELMDPNRECLVICLEGRD